MSCFSSLFSTSPEYKRISYNMEKGNFPFGVLGLPPTPKAMLIHTLCEESSHGAVVLTPDDATAEKLCTDLTALGSKAVTYPARDFNFYSVETSSKEYEQKRIGALSKIISGECNILLSTYSNASILKSIVRDSYTLYILTVLVVGDTALPVDELAVCNKDFKVTNVFTGTLTKDDCSTVECSILTNEGTAIDCEVTL